MSKRKRQGEDEEEEHELDEETLSKILDQAPAVEALDEQGLKKIVLSLEKKINQNQLLRIKYADKPEKFMDSEVDLDEEIKKLGILSTVPELYPNFIAMNAIPSLLSLLNHENVDISNDVIELFNELTEPDILTEIEDPQVLVNAIIENEGLQMLVAYLKRLDESVQEESQAFNNTLSIFENMVELKPEVCSIITEKTDILTTLLQRLQKPEFDDNKLYASEILSILLQSSKENQEKFGKLNGNGLESLLLLVAPYKKKDPPTLEEEEMVANIFNCMCACLQVPDNQVLFQQSEGLELMLIMVKQKKYCRSLALKVLDFAVSNNPANCKHFINVLGLKRLFAALMKKGSKKSKKGFDEASDDEHVLSIIVSLFKHVSGNYIERLSNKFIENDYEKTDRLTELHEKYSNKVRVVDKEIEQEIEEIGRDNLDDDDKDRFYLKRLDSGLFTLQLTDLAMLYVCKYCGDGAKERIKLMLDQKNRSISEIKDVMEEYSRNMGDETSQKEADKERAVILELLENLF